MWEEELCPYSEFIFNKDAMKKTYYNEDIIRGLEEWKKMRLFYRRTQKIENKSF